MKTTIKTLILLVFLSFTVKTTSYASEKTIPVTIDKEYRYSTFFLQFEQEGTYKIKITSPKGKIFENSVIDAIDCTTNIDETIAGEWKVFIENDSDTEIGKVTVMVNGSNEKNTNVIKDISITKDIVGLKTYIKNNSIVAEWSDTNVGTVNITVLNTKTSEILNYSSIKENYYEFELDSLLDEVSISIVSAEDSSIPEAIQTFTYNLNNKLDASITFQTKEHTNQKNANAEVTLNDDYSVVCLNNNSTVVEETNYKKGIYTIEVPLNEGTNETEIYVIDKNGNRFSNKKTIFTDYIAPTLKLEEEYDGLTQNKNIITISGVVTDYDSLLINNQDVTPTGEGKFSTDCTLIEGENKITITAADIAGNVAEYNATIYFAKKTFLVKDLFIVIPFIIVLLILIIGLLKKKGFFEKEKVEKPHKIKEEQHSKENERKMKITKKERKDTKKTISFIPSIIIVVVFMIIAKFIIPYGFVPSESMEPTLKVGDMDVFNGLAYVTREVERGDIILFKSKELNQKMCKRVIGLPNDKITFANGYVFVNGQLCDETQYLDKELETNCDKSFVVPNNSYFLLGDNRMNSYDSRFWENPYINKTDILGKLILIIPTSEIKNLF